MDGILIVDKPGGMTSHDVVSRVRRIAGQKRVGHAGTLDPAATGVLVVLLGRATKISDLLLNSDKSYEGIMVFGAETDTCDADGQIIAESDASNLTEADVISLTGRFTGKIMQVPPAYSAVKIGGRPLYKTAREGKALPKIDPREVMIRTFEITSFIPGNKPEAGFIVECSKGTYIRSLAADIGRETGYGAYLKQLRRTASGAFDIETASSLDDLTAANIAENLRPMAAGLAGMPEITVNAAGAERIMTGFGLDDAGMEDPAGTQVAVLDEDKRVLAIHLTKAAGGTKPLRVIGEGRL